MHRWGGAGVGGAIQGAVVPDISLPEHLEILTVSPLKPGARAEPRYCCPGKREVRSLTQIVPFDDCHLPSQFPLSASPGCTIYHSRQGKGGGCSLCQASLVCVHERLGGSIQGLRRQHLPFAQQLGKVLSLLLCHLQGCVSQNPPNSDGFNLIDRPHMGSTCLCGG